MTEHTAYDGLELEAGHIGKNVKAHAKHAWDDWYYIVVEGTFDNGNTADGVFCRERAADVAPYLKGRN